MRRKGEDQWPDEFYTELSVGEILRRARLQKGQTVPQVGRLLHIRASHLDALERSDFDALPGHTYVIGFVRTYAEYLDLDGGRVVGLLKHQSNGNLRPGQMNVFTPISDTRQPSTPIVLGMICALLLVAVIWAAYQGTRLSGDKNIPAVPMGLRSLEEIERLSKKSAVSAPVPVVSAVEVVQPPSPKIETTSLILKLTADSWLEIRDPDNHVVEARLFRAGEAVPIAAPVDESGRPYTLTAGDAGAVRVILGGKELPPIGQSGKVVRNLLLDPATLKQ